MKYNIIKNYILLFSYCLLVSDSVYLLYMCVGVCAMVHPKDDFHTWVIQCEQVPTGSSGRAAALAFHVHMVIYGHFCSFRLFIKSFIRLLDFIDNIFT